MEYTYNQLKHTKMADLRSIAEGIDHEAVEGYTQMTKDQLLHALTTALGIDVHEHHDVVGVDKAKLKAQIRDLKAKRNKAIEGHDHKGLKSIRRQIHGLKRTLRKATV